MEHLKRENGLKTGLRRGYHKYLVSFQSRVELLCILRRASHNPAQPVLFGPAPTRTQIVSTLAAGVGELGLVLFHPRTEWGYFLFSFCLGKE